MLLTVGDFRKRVATEIDTIVEELQTSTGRRGDEEEHAWRHSLPKLSDFLASSALQKFHLYFEDRGTIALEYQLPASGSFADVVLLGRHADRDAAVVVELKDWVTRADKAGLAEGLIERRGAQELHPSDQVRGYVEYCRHFHSAVQDHNATIHGCVLFTRDFVTRPYSQPPNAELVATYPIFTMASEDTGSRVADYFGERLTAPNAKWAENFATGRYRQSRGFVQQIAQQILSARSRPFELLDNQRRAFALCMAAAKEVIVRWQAGDATRTVVAVIGPPGSGKSAVAARLWAELSLLPTLPEGNLVFVTTSLSQNTNWADIFDRVGIDGARGVVRKASTFHPLHTTDVGRLRREHGETFIAEVRNWRGNVSLLRSMGLEPRDGAGDLGNLISIVDEAHSLINPEREGGVGNFGFAPTLGPQAYHLMRGSVLTFLFLDPAQGFRYRENTTVEDVRAWCVELGATLSLVDLSGVQFRCGGSTEYVSWIESLLTDTPAGRNRVLATAWYLPRVVDGQSAAVTEDAPRKVAEPKPSYGTASNVVAFRRKGARAPFDFRLCAGPNDLEEQLRSVVQADETARLLSTYSRKWRTQGAVAPHELPASQQDFHFPEHDDWCRSWNVVHGHDDYSFFVQGKPGSQVAIDQLAEVGCPYAVRGFDYDYVGLLWLEDLVWRKDRWRLNLSFVHESGLRDLVARSRRAPEGGDAKTLLAKVQQAYRILMTRALKGLFVWISDSETRDHIQNSLSNPQ